MNLIQVWWNNDLKARGSDLGGIWVKEVRENEAKSKGGQLVFKIKQQTKTTSFWSVVRKTKSNDRSSGPSAAMRVRTTGGTRGRQLPATRCSVMVWGARTNDMRTDEEDTHPSTKDKQFDNQRQATGRSVSFFPDFIFNFPSIFHLINHLQITPNLH